MKGKKTGGRAKGTPNKKTSEVRQALATVFSLIGDVEALADWARKNKDKFYEMWVKLLPVQVKHGGDPDSPPIQHEHVATLTAADIAAATALVGMARGDLSPHGGPQPLHTTNGKAH